MAEHHSIEPVVTVIGDVLPRMSSGIQASSRDVRGLLSQIADCYPETAEAMDVAARMIVHLETLRHEATLPLSLGHYENVRTLLTQTAVVEVCHG